jgi:hypothetical protein
MEEPSVEDIKYERDMELFSILFQMIEDDSELDDKTRKELDQFVGGLYEQHFDA